ncbi:MAG: PDGLE domain-containing protein [Acidimicrobiia bacterium]
MRRNTTIAIGALAVILLTGVVLSQFASSKPDGLEYIAEQEGFADQAQDHSLADTPLADYGGDGASRAVAAAIGIAVTLGVGYGLFRLLGRSSTTPQPPPHED